VIYVLGAGRSGSTILGVTLGNCAEVFYAGELDAWLPRGGSPQLDDAQRVRFWDEVRADVDGAQSLFGNEVQVAIERSLAVFRVRQWPARRRLRAAYRQVAERLYRAVSAAAHSPVVVDSSHYPLRARELQSLTGVELHLVYLMRDPQSVVASFNRADVAQYKKKTLTTNVYLWLTNLLAVAVFLRQPRDRRLFVRYEHFIAEPEAILSDILRMVGAGALPPDLAHLRTGPAFQGNRLIRSDEVALEAEPSRTAGSSALTSALQLPWKALLSQLRPRAGAGGPKAGAGEVHAGVDDVETSRGEVEASGGEAEASAGDAEASERARRQ
jgi:hypothetical protein